MQIRSIFLCIFELLLAILSSSLWAEGQAMAPECVIQVTCSVIRGKTGESPTLIVAEATREISVTMRISSLNTGRAGGGGERKFEARILSATGRLDSTPQPSGESGWEKDHLIGVLTGANPADYPVIRFAVDWLGRWRTERDDDQSALGRVSQAIIDELATELLFPGLPPVGQPLEAGNSWQVKHRNGWRGVPGDVFCRSVKLWTNGEAEVSLSVERSKDDSIAKWSWKLGGLPLAVEQARKDHWERMGAATPLSAPGIHFMVEIRVLSGAIPVRPVDDGPETEEPAAGER